MILLTPIPKEQKFVAIYGDGSGAELFAKDIRGHIVNPNGDTIDADHELFEAGYVYWQPISNEIQLWYEHKDG